MEEREGEGRWGEQNRHRSLGPPWANMLPSLPGHLEQAARVAAAGSTPLPRKQKDPAVENVALLQANQWFSSGGIESPRGLDSIWRQFGGVGVWHQEVTARNTVQCSTEYLPTEVPRTLHPNNKELPSPQISTHTLTEPKSSKPCLQWETESESTPFL